MTHYDHVSDLVAGRVQPEGVKIRCLEFKVEEVFFRFERFREWEVSEMSMATYVSLLSRGDTSLLKGEDRQASSSKRRLAVFNPRTACQIMRWANTRPIVPTDWSADLQAQQTGHIPLVNRILLVD